MDFTPLTQVSAGQPVTAQGWNATVQAVNAIADFINSTQATSVRVTIGNQSIDTSTVRVTASRTADSALAEAIGPIPPSKEFQFAGLSPGPHTLRAEATGFAAATQNIEVGDTPVSVTMTLSPSAAFMPPVFGLSLTDTLAALKTANIKVDRILDVAGRDIPTANPGAEYKDAPVLVQYPDAGKALAPGDGAQLVVAAALQVESAIEMPSLSGLTLDEAQKALEKIGLALGKVITRKPRENPA